MIDRTAFGSVLFAALVVVGLAVPAVALSTSAGDLSTSDSTGTAGAMAPQAAQNDSNVDVTVGPQLSTVITVSSDEVQTDFENTAFERSVEGVSEEAKARVIADRADELRDRAESIREDYDDATAAYEDGALTASEYAQRLAVLSARATNLKDSHEQLDERASTVSARELEEAGFDESSLARSVADLRRLTGTGTRALLRQFTGESSGEVDIETENGLSIEVESEDGERSREFERPRDDDDALSVSQALALENARSALSALEEGTWALTDSAVAGDDGAYEFAFALRNAPGLTGEAEVSVDGSSGDVFALEEAIEPRADEADEDAGEADDGDRELAMVVADGTPGPSETITVRVLANGDPAENVTVFVNDQPVGTTDADGRVTVTLPAADGAELTAETDDAEAELEFEFGDPEGDDEDPEGDDEDPEGDDEDPEDGVEETGSEATPS